MFLHDSLPQINPVSFEKLSKRLLSSKKREPKRAQRAFQLARTPGAIQRLSTTYYKVKGSKDFYLVSLGEQACQCEDSARRSVVFCKHLIAAQFIDCLLAIQAKEEACALAEQKEALARLSV